MNSEYKKENLSDITLDVFRNVVRDCISEGCTSFAPLNASGDHFLLFTQYSATSESSRDRQLTVRLHNSTPEMLLTNKVGSFICHVKFHKSLGTDFIANEFFRLFNLFKIYLE